MKITTFKNMKGLIHGNDPKRISCEKSGVLQIGNLEIPIVANEDVVFPILMNGANGEYHATFTDEEKNTYKLKKLEIRNGRIIPPSALTVELMELRCRADYHEDECRRLSKDIEELRNIFDTNSLNFLIK